MKKPLHLFFIKFFKISSISIGVVLVLLFLLPIIFPGKIETEIKKYTNEKLDGELEFSEAKLSFFNHFPSLTLTLKKFKLNGSSPFQKETLVSANEIAFGINLKTLLFESKIHIDKIFVSNALINVKVNKYGESNYNVYKTDSKTVSKDSTSTALKLEKIAIVNCHLLYNDQSSKILIDAKGFNYIGKGDLNESVFDIYTEADIESLDFTFDNETYLKNKKVKADLITKINTNSLAFTFKQNNLKINKLPVQFKGNFDFLKNGYNIDFKIETKNSKLNDFFTALPPQYIKWLEKTKVKGTTDITLSLKGKYITSANKKPDLALNMKIRDGLIETKKAPFPVSNIYLNFDTKLPALNTEQLKVNIDSIFFNVGKDYFKAIVKTNGLKNLTINSKIKASLDLNKIDKAFGFQNIDLRGILKMDIVSNGKYNKLNHHFPITKGTFILKNAYVKTQSYPNPISNINFKAHLTNNSGLLKDTNLTINPVSFEFENNPFLLDASFLNFEDVRYKIKAKGEIDVAKIYQVFSKKGLDLKGYIKADLTFNGKQSDATNGNYNKLQNKGTLLLRNIKTRSEFLPLPFVINEGLFTFNQDKMDFNNFQATYGKSDFKMNGSLQNVINFALSNTEILKGDFVLTSKFIDVNEFMSASNTTDNSPSFNKNESGPTSSLIVIPTNLDLQLKAIVQKVNFSELNIENLKSNLVINQGKLSLANSGFNLIGCQVNMDAFYENEAQSKALFDFKIDANDFDIKRAYNEIKMFREMASVAENAEGIVSLKYKVQGILDHQMQPIYPSLIGNGTISVKKVKLKGFKMFGAVSEKTSNEALKNPDVSKVDINTSIKNNIITIEKFKFKFAGFRPKIEGTTSFDGRLNIKMRLGLPPLGIIGIPLTITGTKEEPKVKLGKKSEDLEETEYVATPPLKTTVKNEVPISEPIKNNKPE